MVLGSDVRRSIAHRGRGTALAAALLLFLTPALAACSDDEGGGGNETPPTPTVEQTEPGGQSPAATAPADAGAAETEIKQNWRKFFDPATSMEDKQTVLENGDRMAPVLQAFSGDERGGQVQAKVSKVEFTSPTEANVTYDLTLKGATALPNASGTAVEQDGTWKVSAKTLCALVQLSGNGSPIPGC
ncbi:hypothetical protein EJ357_09990 [Streptomyces cyaneochromogenes]|uniref:Low molecular weight antigen MTB12-like C-terminal domain-containing protein n=1 Tax=Streptomyces cyaneochromogenes TaxID=2496836 RepID=A0A3S9M3J5_9ACTN|nr:hypothetical protein [Streptomyces cyaneochromogenes]AZQ33759.1 hypothetical protein EJ357_09990 [Streptomyces cyaneochromogenes]